MKQVFIINQLDIHEGKVVAYHGDAYEPVFLKQGYLDGACGPYCLFMALLIAGIVSRDDLNDLWLIKGSTRLGKLIKAMREHSTLFSEGTNSKDLERLLSNSFGKLVHTKISRHSGKRLIPFVIENLEENNPVIVYIKNGNMDHWLLAVGFEKGEYVTKLLFLDPSGKDTSNYWNAAIEAQSKRKGLYQYAWVDHNESSNEFIQFKEAIAIKPNS